MILLIFLFILRTIYGYGEGTTEGFTWRWVNQNEKEPDKYHFWREVVENMGRRLEGLLLFIVMFEWIGAIYWLLLEVIALCVYELRIRYIIYDDWRYQKQTSYDIDLFGFKIKLGYPSAGFMVFLCGLCVIVYFGLITIT